MAKRSGKLEHVYSTGSAVGDAIVNSEPHRFKKGHGGYQKPKTYWEAQRLARTYSTEAIERLAQLMRQKEHKTVALRAAEIILDRAWGKVPQAVTGEAGEGPVKIEVSWKHGSDAEPIAAIDITPNQEAIEAQTTDDEMSDRGLSEQG